MVEDNRASDLKSRYDTNPGSFYTSRRVVPVSKTGLKYIINSFTQSYLKNKVIVNHWYDNESLISELRKGP